MSQATLPIANPSVFTQLRRFGSWLASTTRLRDSLLQAFGLAVILTAALTWVGFAVTGTVNWWEVASVGFSFATVWLCVKQSRWNYPLNVLSVILLSYVFWQAGLYGSMALNLYLIFPLIYGWFVWGSDKNTKPVQHVSLRSLPLYAVATGLTWWGASALITALGGVMSVLDGWLLVGSILAQYLLDRKKLEAWLVFVLVNIVSIFVYFQAGLPVLALQFGLFLINAVVAYFIWKRTMGKPVKADVTPMTQKVA